MIKRLFVGVVTAFFLSVNIFAQVGRLQEYPDAPDYETLVNHFFNEYQDLEDDSRYIEFARKPTGWYVQLKLVKNNKHADDYLYYAFEKKAYENLDHLFVRGSNPSDKFKSYKDFALGPFNERMFRIHPYYGYRGWGEDIVSAFEEHSDELNDLDLYSLGRAHSAISASITFNDRGASRTDGVQLLKNGNSMSSSYLDWYLYHTNKARIHFKALADRNPNFKTIVGTIRTKYANEVMEAYLDLIVTQNKTIAEAQVSSGVYPENILTDARNTLDNCPANAIYMSAGDNDFFPLHYLQIVEGYRTDVAVVSASLLNIPAYVQALRREGLVILSIGQDVYDSLNVVIFNGHTPLTWYDFEYKALYEFKGKNQENLNASHIQIIQLEDTVDLTAKRVLLKYEIALLDIVNSNRTRPVMLRATPEKDELLHGNTTALGRLYEVSLNGEEFDFDRSLAYFKSIDTSTYCNPIYFPKTEDGEYIDKVFTTDLYYKLAFLCVEAKQSEYKDYEALLAIFEEWRKSWVIKPSEQILDALYPDR